MRRVFTPRIYPRFASEGIDEPKPPGPVGSIAAGFPPRWERALPAPAGARGPFHHLQTIYRL